MYSRRTIRCFANRAHHPFKSNNLIGRAEHRHEISRFEPCSPIRIRDERSRVNDSDDRRSGCSADADLVESPSVERTIGRDTEPLEVEAAADLSNLRHRRESRVTVAVHQAVLLPTNCARYLQ